MWRTANRSDVEQDWRGEGKGAKEVEGGIEGRYDKNVTSFFALFL